MARAVADIENDIRALTADEKLELLRSLIRELVEGKVKAVPGRLVFERLRSRLAG